MLPASCYRSASRRPSQTGLPQHLFQVRILTLLLDRPADLEKAAVACRGWRDGIFTAIPGLCESRGMKRRPYERESVMLQRLDSYTSLAAVLKGASQEDQHIMLWFALMCESDFETADALLANCASIYATATQSWFNPTKKTAYPVCSADGKWSLIEDHFCFSSLACMPETRSKWPPFSESVSALRICNWTMQGDTLLHVARRYGHKKLEVYLSLNGAEETVTNAFGWLP